MAAKKTRKTQVLTARLVLIIVAIAIAFGAFRLTKTSFKILLTQGKLISYYNKIQDANDQHDYYYDMALMYPSSGYMKDAEEWDEKAVTLTEERADFVASATDSVVIWASRDGVEVLTILAGLVEIIIAAVLWCLDGLAIWVLVPSVSVKKRRRVTHRSDRAVAPYRTR